MHARAGTGDFLNVLDALCRFEDRVDEERLLQPVLRFELCQQLVEIMDIPCPFDLGQHDHIELVADLGDEFGDVVEHPGAVQRVDAGPEARCAEIMGPASPIRARSFSLCPGKKWIMRSSTTGSSR